MFVMERFLCIILAFITGFVSYPLSFLPDNADNEYNVREGNFLTLNGEAVSMSADCTYEKDGTIELSEKVTIDLAYTKADWFNYYGISYVSDSYVKGTITYMAGVKKKTEEFFLEPSEDGVFFSFIDNCLKGTKANALCSLSLEPLDSKKATIKIRGISTFNREIPEEEIFIENENHKLGVNLLWGGAVSYLEDMNSDVEAVRTSERVYVDSKASERYGVDAFSKNVNLINCNDAGRLIQQSYYGTTAYDCGEYMGNVWPYNPVQGGNQFNDSSKIVDIRCDDNSIYVKSRPLDWAKEKEHITPSYMEAKYSLVNGAVHIECRFVDFSGYEPRLADQEIPAFYCIEPLNNFVYYAGDKPWTDDALTNEPDLIFWPDAGYPTFSTQENWAAFTGEFPDSFGIGVYVTGQQKFLAGVYAIGEEVGENPAKSGPTSYFAVVEQRSMNSFEPFEYDYYVATGTTEEIRSIFKTVK